MSNLQFFENTGWIREQKTPITTAESAPSVISTTQPTSMITVEGYRSIRVMVVGDTANDDCDCTLYGVERSQTRDSNTVYLTHPLARMDTIVIGTTVLVGELGTGSELLADAYTTNAAQTYGTSVFAFVIAGAVVTYNQAGNDIPGWWGVTDLGNLHGVVVGFPTLNTGNYFSYCYMLDR